MPEQRRAVGYVRVSSVNADDQAVSGDAQEQLIRDWAQATGVDLVGVHRDEGVSGANGIDTREALPVVMDALKHGDADTSTTATSLG